MQNKSNQVTKRKFLWFNNHTTILPANGYKHHPFKVKSACFPHMTTSCQNHHIPHCSAKLLTTHRRQSCWGGKGGNRLVWREKGDSTHAEQVRGGGGGALCWVTMESYPCTCYMRLRTLVQLHRNRQSSDPEHSQGNRNKNKKTEKQRWERMVTTGQKPGNISFADREMRLEAVSVWAKDTVYGTRYETLVSF